MALICVISVVGFCTLKTNDHFSQQSANYRSNEQGVLHTRKRRNTFHENTTISTQRMNLISQNRLMQFKHARTVLYVMNIANDGSQCKHPNNLHPLVCISTCKNALNIVRVNVTDSWHQLGNRMLIALPEIAKRFDFEWYVKIDPDTTVYSERLVASLNLLSLDAKYVGQVFSYSGYPNYASGGAGYAIRRTAMQFLNDTSHCDLIPSKKTNYEDVTIGNCLFKNGISVVQLDGMYGDDLETSYLLATGKKTFLNHVFPVKVNTPLLTTHKEKKACQSYTAEKCLREHY